MNRRSFMKSCAMVVSTPTLLLKAKAKAKAEGAVTNNSSGMIYNGGIVGRMPKTILQSGECRILRKKTVKDDWHYLCKTTDSDGKVSFFIDGKEVNSDEVYKIEPGMREIKLSNGEVAVWAKGGKDAI